MKLIEKLNINFLITGIFQTVFFTLKDYIKRYFHFILNVFYHYNFQKNIKYLLLGVLILVTPDKRVMVETEINVPEFITFFALLAKSLQYETLM